MCRPGQRPCALFASDAAPESNIQASEATEADEGNDGNEGKDGNEGNDGNEGKDGNEGNDDDEGKDDEGAENTKDRSGIQNPFEVVHTESEKELIGYSSCRTEFLLQTQCDRGLAEVL